MSDVLLLVALRTDQPEIARRLQVILAACQPVVQVPLHSAVAWAQPVGEVTPEVRAALAAILDPRDLARLGLP